jgi:hypothetical protein
MLSPAMSIWIPIARATSAALARARACLVRSRGVRVVYSTINFVRSKGSINSAIRTADIAVVDIAVVLPRVVLHFNVTEGTIAAHGCV